MNGLTQVIAAASTPPGKGGVAIIRISGEGAAKIAERVFLPKGRLGISECAPRVQIYGHVIDGGRVIDDVLATRFDAPNSYTGEETVEIACHGGILVTALVLEAVLKAGAVPAGAGEFTRRAFVNGRLSLTEAEAIANLLEAATREQVRLASSDSRGVLAQKIKEIRSALLSLMSSIYARIDYPDEDLGDFSDEELLGHLYNIRKNISSLLSTYKTGRAINEGVRTVICGKANVGKSTLYNLLLGEDAAIVTDIAGTTRDVLERSVQLGRVMLRIADTAGIRASADVDAVESIGIEKSRKMMQNGELLFTIFDLSRPFDEEDELMLREISSISAPKIALLNKCDAECLFDRERIDGLFDCTVEISAKDGGEEVTRELGELVNRLFTDESIVIGESAVISSARQNAALARACEFTSLAIASLESGFAQDAVSSDVERALGAISELDGRAVNEEVVEDIFSKFCVGK